MTTMYYGDTEATMAPALASKAVQFVALLASSGLAVEVEEDGYWGLKDLGGDWLMKVEDGGHGNGHWYVSTPEQDADALAEADALASA